VSARRGVSAPNASARMCDRDVRVHRMCSSYANWRRSKSRYYEMSVVSPPVLCRDSLSLSLSLSLSPPLCFLVIP